MNKKQKAVLLISATVIILMGLIPPWYYHAVMFTEQRIPFTIRGEWDYDFIFAPPPVNEKWDSPKVVPNIDFGRLFVQWAMVIIAASVLIFVLKDNKK